MADEVPAFDDIPSFDDMPDAQPAQSASSGAVPAFDDIPSFDDMPDDSRAVQPEGMLKTGARAAAHGIIPTVGGLLGAGAGSALGPLGTVGGMVAGSYAGDKLQDLAQEHGLLPDDRAQMQADAEANPRSAQIGGAIPAVATLSAGPATLAERAVGAGVMGGFQAVQDWYTTGHLDPAAEVVAAGVGAIAPHMNRAGNALTAAGSRLIPGRPGRVANPAAAPAHEAVDDTTPEQAVGDWAESQQPPTRAAAQNAEIGTPQSRPTNSQGTEAVGKADPSYAKKTPAEANNEVTTGEMDPATRLAMGGEEPAPVQSTEQQAPVTATVSEPQLPVEPGFPQPGEPLAVGENEATPLPRRGALPKFDDMPDENPNRISSPPPVQDAENSAAPPPFKGEPATPTPDQARAGNYFKGRTHDFGKPVALENKAGSIRRSHPEDKVQWESELPADYGYFNKTKGADSRPGKPEGIDFYRAVPGSPEFGQKHFIIDQKNADTGAFDEHKVMKYFKDQAAAVDTYLKAFSDKRGGDRLHDITEVDRPTLTAWLQKHTMRAATKPYGEPIEIAKPKAVVKAAAEKLRAAGRTEEADKLLAAPADQVKAAIGNARVRKYGVPTGNSAGYPVEGLTTEAGTPVTANTKAKAAARTAQHKAVQDWYEKSSRPSQLKAEDESNGELLDRIRNVPKGDWSPAHKPREWLLAREAARLLKKPTPGNIQKFRIAESDLRGSEEDVNNYRSRNRTEADIALSRRAGDEAIAGAEAKMANEGGRNNVEDEMIERIDAKRKGVFDIPHEEAETMVRPTEGYVKDLPRRTVDVSDSHLAKIDTKKISADVLARKREADMLAGRKSAQRNVPSEDLKTTPKGRIEIDPKTAAKYLAELNKAKNKRLMEDDEIKRQGLGDHLAAFSRDTTASLNINKLKADFDRLMKGAAKFDPTTYIDKMKKTEHKSYLARKSEGVRDDYVRSIDNKFNLAGKMDVNAMVADLRRAKKEWEPITPDEDKQIFRARDADSAGVSLPGKLPGKTNVESLPQKLQDFYNKRLKPVFDENDAIFAHGKVIDEKRFGDSVQSHIEHIRNGDTSKYNMLKKGDDPMKQGHHGFSVSANAAKDRKYFVLERAHDGKRIVINANDEGFTTWDNGKSVSVKDPTFKFADGNKYTVTPKKGAPIDYTMRHAMVDEIMQHARENKQPIKYHQSARFSALVSHGQLGAMVRHLEMLQDIKNDPRWKDWTTTRSSDPRVLEDGWATTNMKNFERTYMHPDLKALMDDFAGRDEDAYQALNAAVTKLIFVAPTAHWGNVGMHTIAGRGWDNLSIPKNLSMLSDLPWAVKSVLTQDAYQRALNRNNAGTVYGKVLTQNSFAQLAKAFNIEVQRNPSKWGPVADKFGVPMADLVRSFFNASKHALWAGSDVMETLRIRELQRKGIPMEQAIIDAERDIPNYRVPTKLFGQRVLAEKFFNSALFAFSRYHFGMINAFANVFKDLFSKNATMGDRVDAAGKVLAMGLMSMVVMPMLDGAYKKITGNENAEANRRGPLTIPSHIAGAVEGKEDVMAPVRSALTLSPLTSLALGALSNRDWRGQPIVKQGDLYEGSQGHPQGYGRAATAAADYAARGLVAPYNMFASTYMKGDADSTALGALGKTIRNQALDVKDVSPKSAKYNELRGRHARQEVSHEFRHPDGPGVSMFNKVFGR